MIRFLALTMVVLFVFSAPNAEAQDVTLPGVESPEHSDFKERLCAEYRKGVSTPFAAQLEKACPGFLERRFTCTAGPNNKGNVHGNCAGSTWEHIWNNRPYCSTVRFWCEWGGGTFALH